MSYSGGGETLVLDLNPTNQVGSCFTGSGSVGGWTKLTWSFPVGNMNGDYVLFLKSAQFDINGYTGSNPEWISIESPQITYRYGGGFNGTKLLFYVSGQGTNGGNLQANNQKIEATINRFIDIQVLSGLSAVEPNDYFNRGVLTFSVYKNENTDRGMVPNFMKWSNQ